MSEASTKTLTAADAAKLVKRTVIVQDGEAKREKKVAIAANEVLSFKDYGTHVVVVTTDGQKFSSVEA